MEQKRRACITPLNPLHRLSQQLEIDLRVKQDDVFPMFGGGNKARKINHILDEVDRSGCNALVTTGGLQSNHARVVALAAASRGWRCKLVLHGDQRDSLTPRGNLLLMRLSGAEIDIVSPDQINSGMQSAMRALITEGFRPFEIPGGGHMTTGGLAYLEAVAEIDSAGWCPDWIVLASGTGGTQAGILAGIEHRNWPTRVVGISVARPAERGQEAVDSIYKAMTTEETNGSSGNIDFRDDWVGPGYSDANPNVYSVISMVVQTEGLLLDPVYTGKAFTALIDLVKQGEIARGERVLFWHTGGLFNLLASDISLRTGQ